MDLVNEIMEISKKRLNHFISFQQIAAIKGNHLDNHLLKKQKGQYKTEKWLQAEIAVALFEKYRNKNITIIPEYTKIKWDLYIEMNGKKTLIELKCFSASGQQPGNDFNPIKKDIDKLANAASNREFKEYDKIYIVLLPKEGDYLDGIKNRIENEIQKRWQKDEIILKNGKDQGITFLYIRFCKKMQNNN